MGSGKLKCAVGVQTWQAQMMRTKSCSAAPLLPHAVQYRHLYKLREALPEVPFIALTATATPKVGCGFRVLAGHLYGIIWKHQTGDSRWKQPGGSTFAVAQVGPNLPLWAPSARRCEMTSLPTCASSPTPASEAGWDVPSAVVNHAAWHVPGWPWSSTASPHQGEREPL